MAEYLPKCHRDIASLGLYTGDNQPYRHVRDSGEDCVGIGETVIEASAMKAEQRELSGGSVANIAKFTPLPPGCLRISATIRSGLAT